MAKFDVKVELSTELESFTQDPDGVTAQIIHHQEDGEEWKESLRVKYLVSAEGARSMLIAT